MSICLIAGFGARRLLPQMAGHLEQQIAQANKDASEAKEKAEDATEEVTNLRAQLADANHQVATMRIRTQLKHAVDSPDADRVWKTALADAKELIQARTSRISSLWIDAARIEVRYVTVEAALDTLSDMISLVEADVLPKNNNYPTAFFNRACYLSKTFSETGDPTHLRGALDSLRKISDAADDPCMFVKYIEADQDLDPIRNEEGFKEVLDVLKNAKPGL